MQHWRRFSDWWHEFRLEARSDGGVYFHGGLLFIALMGLAFLMASTEAEPIAEPSAMNATSQR